MIGSQRRLSCKNGVLAFGVFFSLLSSFDGFRLSFYSLVAKLYAM